MTMKLFVLLILAVFASEKKSKCAENSSENEEKFESNSILVKIEEGEYAKVNKESKSIGVIYIKDMSKWRAQRWTKNEKKRVYNGCYDDEVSAAHASDTLARKLMENGEQKLKLNFPDDYTEVYRENGQSKYIGVAYVQNGSKCRANRWSKHENKNVYNGCYDDEETAAHASDTLARNLMETSKQKLKLNFPDDHTKVYPKKELTSKYFGVCCDRTKASKGFLKWRVQRWSNNEYKMCYNGYYDDEATAAHASDTLARQLMGNGEQNHKLNFPDDNIEVYSENQKKKRKRPKE